MAPRRCVVCGSRQWHKEPTSGLVTCSEGHVLQNYRTEARILDEFGPHAMKKRTLKTSRKKKERQSKADPQLYHGDRARYHYFQCLQLILRHQIKAAIDLWKLPSEFEAVCRDIWTIHLSLLPIPLPAEPLLFNQDQEYDSKPTKPPRAQGSEHDTESETSDSSSEGENVDPEMDALLRELSEPSSSENEDIISKPPPIDKVRKRKGRGSYDFPANNIAVLVVSCWTLRIPILYMDFSRAIEDYDIPYLDAVQLLPRDLRRHLTKQNVHALSPHFSPAPTILHALASRIAKRAYSTYGIYTPEVNAAPILWRSVRHLCGGAALYNMAKTLAGYLSLPLTLHHTLAPMLVALKQDDPENHKFDNLPPEVALIAAVIIVIRLAYGLDGTPRSPKQPHDPAFALPEYTAYIKQMRTLSDAERTEIPNLFSPQNPMTVQDLDETTMDEYLEFCAEMALSERDGAAVLTIMHGMRLMIREDTAAIITEYFPMASRQRAGVTVRRTPEFPLPPIMHSPDEDSLGPGESYRIYHARDVLGCVSEDYRFVVGRAARWTGVPEDYMFSVIERFERRFLRWWKTKQRRERDLDSESVIGEADADLQSIIID